MKTLILLRHATADPPPPGKRDFDRPLSTTGRKEAAAMSAKSALANIRPDRILASAARRTRETAEIFAQEQHLPRASIQLSQDLYNASLETLFAAITDCAVPETSSHLLLIAHNPGISELAGTIVAERLPYQLPPCGMVAVQLNIRRWTDCSLSKHPLLFFDYPNSK